MNYPKTVDELVNWNTRRGRDTFGSFSIITGFEGTGGCFWCGKELTGRRRFCKQGSGCWTRYQEHFAWGYAASRCLKRYEYQCVNCGIKGIGLYMGDDRMNLRMHHIIPLNGRNREVSVFNIYWNLLCLCHDCHMLLHMVMRLPVDLLDRPTLFNMKEFELV